MTAPPVLTAERIDAMLSVMAEVCLGSVVEAGERQKAAADDEAFERCGRALQGACRNLRQTIAMKQRFDREEAAKAREAHAAAETIRKEAERNHRARVELKRTRVRRHLEALVWDEYEDDEAEALCDDVDARLSDLVHDDDFVDTPIETLIARLADDIGLNDERPEPEPAPPQAPKSHRGARGDHAEIAEIAETTAPSASSATLSATSAVESDGSAATEPVEAPPDPPPRLADPPPEPYVPPWERLRSGQRMPGGSGW